MKRIARLVLIVLALAGSFTGCASVETETAQNPAASPSEAQQKGETQSEKLMRLHNADSEKLVTGSDGMVTIESIEAAYQPEVISSIGEITAKKLSEPGRPYYFKIQAIYKGREIWVKDDNERTFAFLQDLGEVKQGSAYENTLGAALGVDSKVYPVVTTSGAASTLPTDANSIATFYLIAVKGNDEGKESFERGVLFVRNTE